MDGRQKADNGLVAVADQYGQGRRRIDLQQFRLAQPGLDLLHVQRHAIFGAHQADEPRGRIKGMMDQARHLDAHLFFRPPLGAFSEQR